FLAFRETPKGQAARRGGLIGSPDTIRQRLERFEASNVDQVIFLNQALAGVDPRDADAVARATKEGNTEGAATLGFTAAMAAYGGFFIPKSYGTSITMTGGPEAAL
ncbi:MAG: hypothetical protein V4609_02280, partial [Pseudomonadota bacterium]